MAVQLPPMPNNPITDTFVWRDWFFKISQALVQQASIAWSSIDFTGSNLIDIQTRQHGALQAVQGGLPGQQYHLTAAEHAVVAALPTFPLSTSNGGTGAAGTLTGYVKGNGTSPMTASTTIPFSDIVTTYGSFSSSVDQNATANNTPTIVTFNTTDMANNMSLASNKVTISTAGKYNIQFSLQFVNTHNQSHNTWVWLRKNGTDLAGTASKYDVPSTHGSSDGYLIAVANFFVTAAVGDYFELVWASDQVYIVSPLQNGVYIEAYAASTSPFTVPAVPSAVMTLSPI